MACAACGDDVAAFCAAYGVKDDRDARKALDLLRAAADLARAENAESVTTDYVTEERKK